MIEIIIPGEPQGKARPRVTVRGGYAHAYTPEKTAQYEAHIRQCYWQKYRDAYKYVEKPVRVEVEAVFGIPKSASRTKRQDMLDGIIKPTKKPDADNILKAVCDALNSLAWGDDAQVTSVKIIKVYGDEPCVRVRIYGD